MEKALIKTMSIGDIHGRDDWKYFTHGDPRNFESWAISISNGANPNDSIWKEDWDNYMSYDKIIFVGDYVDSFTISNLDIKKNLEDIILFKKSLPDKVVLLLGNHDVQYIVENQICSGYRAEAKHDLYQLFTENINLFQLSYQIKNTVWTHAGVTKGWLNELDADLFNPDERFYKLICSEINHNSSISEKLNTAWKFRLPVLFNVDRSSGGSSKWAGPVWVRPNILDNEFVPGIKQIVGHTPQPSIYETDNVAYIDCLEYGNAGDAYYVDL